MTSACKAIYFAAVNRIDGRASDQLRPVAFEHRASVGGTKGILPA
jgi:hypothetical protein